ncbi:uncharacterized protein LOC130456192 [Monodelphis domestica]|uniref:uncharacterized protein LOC130456192 n=1 Tax=Monodelphis domestica TaxID=13616 RepID=UPI0024E19BE1|nr:uncharacterized protein LOC130456192 [Monodelphis domestica]
MPFLGAAVRRDGTGRTGVGGYWGGRGRRRRRRREEEEQEEGGGVQWSPLQKARAAGGGGEPERQQGAHSAAAGGGMGMVTVTAAASTQRGLGPGRLPAAAAGLPPAGRPAFLSRRPLRGWQDWRDGAGCWLDGWLLPSGPGLRGGRRTRVRPPPPPPHPGARPAPAPAPPPPGPAERGIGGRGSEKGRSHLPWGRRSSSAPSAPPPPQVQSGPIRSGERLPYRGRRGRECLEILLSGCGKVGTLIHCWWSCELIQPFWRAIWNYAQRATKKYLPFDPVIALLGLYPKEIMDKKTCTKIFIAALFVVAQNWKTRGCPSIGEWLNKLWYMLVMEYYCAKRNNKVEKFHGDWNNLQEVMQSERSRTRRTLYTETNTLWYNRT